MTVDANEERACAVCGSYGTTQTEVEWRGNKRKVWLCRFCWMGVGREVAEGLVTDVDTILIVRHASLIAHELLAAIEKRR